MTYKNKCFIIKATKKNVKFMEQEHNIETINKGINVARYEKENIKNLIYNIRGKQVMLDSDVAMLYQYTTKRINETVQKQINFMIDL